MVSGTIGGYFQSYTLGNILSAQFFEAAAQANPKISAEIASGDFSGLHSWLKENIYRYGRQYPAAEIIKSAVGRDLEIEPYVRYLKTKYGKIYQL